MSAKVLLKDAMRVLKETSYILYSNYLLEKELN